MRLLKRRPCRRLLAVLAGSALIGGCSSGFTTIAPTPHVNYQVLGPAKGSACGSMMVLIPQYYFIPVGENSRVQRAYDAAVESVPGATGLVDVTMHENWYWWLLGTSRCVTINGEAIK